MRRLTLRRMSSIRPLACLAAVVVGGCVGAPNGGTADRPLPSLPAPAEAGPQELWEVDPADQTMTGRWFLELAGESITLTVTSDPGGAHLAGTATADDGSVDPIDSVTWDATTG